MIEDLVTKIIELERRIASLECQPGPLRFEGAGAPGVGDDENDGYSVGSLWLNTTADKLYVCLDQTVGAAVWKEIVNTISWTTWTPTITQSGVVTCTVTLAKYKIVDKICHVEVLLTITGAGTGANDIVIGGQPAAMQPANISLAVHGIATVMDAGTALYFGFVYSTTATAWRFRDSNTRGVIGSNPNFALANTDTIWFNMTYEVA